MRTKPRRLHHTTRSDVVHLGVLQSVVKVASYLTAREKRAAIALLAATVANAVLGIVGLAGVLPFFQLLITPDPLAAGTVFGDVFRAIGVTSVTNAIIISGALLIALILIKNLFGVYYTRMTGRFCAALESRLSTDVLTAIVRAPFAWYIRQNASMLRDVVMSYVLEITRGIIRPAINLANSALLLAVAVAFIVPFTPYQAVLVALFTFATAFGFVRLVRPRIRAAGERKRQQAIVAGVVATETIYGGRETRMSAAGQILLSEFKREYSAYSYADASARQWQTVPRSGIEVVGIAAIVLIAILALTAGADRLQIASTLALYAVVAIRLVPVMGEVSNSLATIQTSLPSLSHFEQVRRELPKASVVALPPLPADWSAVALSGVSYRYAEQSDYALVGVTLAFQRGKTYGVVGSSGAGKSTLADVLAGLLLAETGALKVDDLVLDTEEKLVAWRGRVAYVAQSPLVFDMSLAENIAMGATDPQRDQRLQAAVATAGLSKVVDEFEAGLDTPIGDRGTRLSGGQRQRVAIARAIYQHADLLILDEATSALDSLTELEVAEALDALRGQMTTVAIAHRLSTIARCDEIILLEKGRVVAVAPHAVLMNTRSEYRAFVSAQEMLKA